MRQKKSRLITALVLTITLMIGVTGTVFGAVSFRDVKDSSQYFYTPVYWAVNNGITKGYGDNTFKPKKECTRKDMIVFLWRLAGRPGASGKINSKDIDYDKESDSYKAILWGSNKGIVKGFSGNLFKPNQTLNRKDTMIMMYRFAGKPRVSGTMQFADCKKYGASTDTYKAILWGTKKGITKGYANGTFKPEAKCLREHVVTFIYRYKHPKSSTTTAKTQSTSKTKSTSSKSKTVRSSSGNSSGHGTVYWTPSGKKYHYSRDCSTLKRSKTIYSGSISECGGRTLCKVCGY